MRFHRAAVTAVVVAAAALGASPAEAAHSWGGYHWSRTSNPFSVKLGDNLSASWKPYLATTSSDWSTSTVLDATVVGGSTNSRVCKGSKGTVQVCNAAYGQTGWLGVASISISGVHITQGTVKLNDTYFNTATYDTPAWRNLVTCQEVGHTFGLGHQDEVFDNPNLGTCMDYTNNPSTNQHPNAHDFDELVLIYGHSDSSSIAAVSPARSGASAADRADNPGEWGRLVSGSERPRQVAVYERDFGGDDKEVTFVIWA